MTKRSKGKKRSISLTFFVFVTFFFSIRSHRVALQEENLFKTRNSYRKLAQRAATCYNILHYLRQLSSDYVMPLEHFLDLFDTCIFQSEK